MKKRKYQEISITEMNKLLRDKKTKERGLFLAEKSVDTMNNVEIEYLPMIGKASTIKTNKQGRTNNLSNELKDHTTRKYGKAQNYNILRLTCVNIMKNAKAWNSQKEFAQKIVNKLNDGLYVSMQENMAIPKIAKKLHSM
jgi:hypothetical protein